MEKAPFEWRARSLSVGGVLFVTALTVLLAQQDFAWLLWPVLILGLALMVVAFIAIVLDRHSVSIKARLLAPWQRLKLLRLRSPFYLLSPTPTAKTEAPSKGLDLSDLAAMQRRYDEYDAKYGKRILRLSRLGNSDLKYLNKGMADLRPLVYEAGHSMAELLEKVLVAMAGTGQNDARYWVADHLRQTHVPRMARVLARFLDEAEQGTDSREALAAFHSHYQTSIVWAVRMSTFLGKSLDSVTGYKAWFVRHEQYMTEFKDKLLLPQFEVLHAWVEFEKANSKRGTLR